MRGSKIVVVAALLGIPLGCSDTADSRSGETTGAGSSGSGSGGASGDGWSGGGSGDGDGDGDGDSSGGDGDGDGDGDSGGDRFDVGSGGWTGGEGGEGGDEEPPSDVTGGTDETGTGTTGDVVCETAEPVVLYLSPDDSNSMSSPVQVREAVLSNWNALGQVAIRTWEFFNYYTFDYPAPPAGTLSIVPELSQAPGAPEGEYVLQIGVSSELVIPAARPPVSLTLVLDTSGSMGGHPMEMLKETGRAIAHRLQAGDRISIVTWNTANNIVLGGYEVSGPDDATLLSAINGLAAGGGTNLNAGLVTGYQLANDTWAANRINRVVLVSDGGANVGVTDVELIGQNAELGGEDGIYMVGVGVGTAGTYRDDLMDAVTDAGKGAAIFVPSAAEAHKVFDVQFENTFMVAGRDVQVRVDLPPGFAIQTFSGEEWSGDPTEVEPQHIAPNDTMVFHQTIESCAPELIADDTELTVTVRYRDAITFEENFVATTATFGELLASESSLQLKGDAVWAYTQALKALRDLDADAPQKLQAARDALAAAQQARPEDRELDEILSVLQAF